MTGNTRYGQQILASGAKSVIDKIDEEISGEMHSAEPDIHRVYRLEEAKRLQGMFGMTPLSGAYAKYRSPW